VAEMWEDFDRLHTVSATDSNPTVRVMQVRFAHCLLTVCSVFAHCYSHFLLRAAPG
jgi:hypothetical protein